MTTNLRQFQPTFYLVMVLGMTGFAVSIETPGLWVLCMAALGLHAWLMKTGRFRPMPRLVANAITIVLLLLTFQVVRTVSTPIIAIGQFLVLMQGVKLFELRANRDYAQLLVLSLLLMVAGAISTTSLIFGIILAIYLFVALYCCLLFHLKTENDHALKAQTLPIDKLNQATLRQDQRFLPRSMKKLTGLVSVVALSAAVIVFLFCPRGTGAGLFGQMSFRPGQTLTGFSDQMSLGQINSITQNMEVVANVQVWRNGRAVQGTEPIYLRGKALDRYNPLFRRWERQVMLWPRERRTDATVELLPPNLAPVFGDEYRQKISLRPTGTTALFAMGSPVILIASRDIGPLRYYYEDQTLEAQSAERLAPRFDYEVISRTLPPSQTGPYQRPPILPDEKLRQRIRDYILRPEVGGADEQGRPLVSLRPFDADYTDLDARIAASVEKHLRTTFDYTLDLPSLATIDPRRDPVDQFLYDWKKGHCEFFASAMALLLHTAGIQARVVTGFKCDEFDPNMGHYYIVRQAHAHMWVEMRTPEGWRTYDPTSGNTVDAARGPTAWQAIKHFFNFLEYKWAVSVIAYDAEKRDNLITSLDRRVTNTLINSSVSPNSFWRKVARLWKRTSDTLQGWMNAGSGYLLGARAIATVVALLAAWLIYRVGRSITRRWKMRRRAQRIGLEELPTSEQIRLARQLGFYERLMALLDHHRIQRPEHLTPAEFGHSLIFLPLAAYDAIQELTAVFYAVRYGQRQLSTEEQATLEGNVDSLAPVLGEAVSIR